MKSILIDYTIEVPLEYFDKFCKKAAIGKRHAADIIKDSFITAGDNEINRLFTSLETYNK